MQRLSTKTGVALAAVAVACVTVLCASPAWAESISVSVDRTEATTEDSINMIVTIEGDRTAAPKLPEFRDFDVYSRGQSTQMRVINGQVSSSVRYTYALYPKRAGMFNIGRASVRIGNQTHYSQPFQIKIVGAEQKPREESPLFLQVTLSNPEPYVSEQITYTWRLYRAVRLSNASVDLPDLDGFTVEALGEQKDYSTTLRGQKYEVTEIRKALFPQQVGTLTIPPSKLTAEVIVQQQGRRPRGTVFDSFFGSARTQTKILRSDPIQVNVRPLPAAPENFSGLVGQFKVRATLSKKRLKVGESTTLTVTIGGRGNWQMISEPNMGELSKFKIYSDKSTTEPSKRADAIAGRKVFRKALVPLEPGEHTLPALSVGYFDPADGVFKTARTNKFMLRVSQPDEVEQLQLTESLSTSGSKIAITILADDILPLHKSIDSLRSAQPSGTTMTLWGTTFLLPPLLYLGLALTYRRREQEAADVSLKRRRIAMSTAHKQLKKLRSDGLEQNAAIMAASQIIREYMGNKLNLTGQALTSDEAASTLTDCGVSELTIAELRTFLSSCERSQYGASGDEMPSSSQQLASEVETLLNKLDKEIQG